MRASPGVHSQRASRETPYRSPRPHAGRTNSPHHALPTPPQAPYAGGDCSVAPSGSACAPGSRRPVPRPEARGTCWQACREDGSGFDEGSCAEWTCDEDVSGAGHVALRRKGSELACVEDLCTAGNHTVMDTAGGWCWERGQGRGGNGRG